MIVNPSTETRALRPWTAIKAVRVAYGDSTTSVSIDTKGCASPCIHMF